MSVRSGLDMERGTMALQAADTPQAAYDEAVVLEAVHTLRWGIIRAINSYRSAIAHDCTAGNKHWIRAEDVEGLADRIYRELYGSQRYRLASRIAYYDHRNPGIDLNRTWDNPIANRNPQGTVNGLSEGKPSD